MTILMSNCFQNPPAFKTKKKIFEIKNEKKWKRNHLTNSQWCGDLNKQLRWFNFLSFKLHFFSYFYYLFLIFPFFFSFRSSLTFLELFSIMFVNTVGNLFKTIFCFLFFKFQKKNDKKINVKSLNVDNTA